MIQFQSSFNMIKFVLIPFKEIILVANIQSCIFLKNPLARFVKHKLIPSREGYIFLMNNMKQM